VKDKRRGKNHRSVFSEFEFCRVAPV